MANEAHNFVPKKLQLRVWGMDARGQAFVETMSTVQIAEKAVEVDSKRQLRIGEIVGGGINGLKSRFRIVSSFISGKDTFRVQLEDLGDTCMWPVELASPDVVTEEKQERRKHQRFPARGTVEIHNADRTASAQARLVDLSAGGCYIETLAPASKDSQLDVTIHSEGFNVEARVRVCTSHPSIGMGAEIVRFSSAQDSAAFRELLALTEQNFNG
jgi:hypothetical protein